MNEKLKLIAYILVLIGGITLGLVGLFDFNIFTVIFGIMLARVIFILIGVAAGYLCWLLYQEKMKKPTL